MTAGTTIVCRGERLVLSSERAVYWPARRSLLVADWHLGKAAVFARRGLAIPGGGDVADMRRLDGLLTHYDCCRLVVLGDLMHAPPTKADAWPEQLAAWLDGHRQLDCVVVAGNHDRVTAATLPDALRRRIDWHPEPLLDGPFCFDHEPGEHATHYVVAGHLHPTRRLEAGADRVRAPAFWFRRHCAVLPAFGEFTGGHNIQPRAGERVFVTGPDAVIEVSAA